jgi:hypothetical protein
MIIKHLFTHFSTLLCLLSTAYAQTPSEAKVFVISPNVETKTFASETCHHQVHTQNELSRTITTITLADCQKPLRLLDGVGGEHINSYLVSAKKGVVYKITIKSTDGNIGTHIEGCGTKQTLDDTIFLCRFKTDIKISVYAHPVDEYEIKIEAQSQ